ncbi:uncharacterized protein LOC115220916 [Argonauta hians]
MTSIYEWSEGRLLKDFLELEYNLPMLLKPTEGHYGKSEDTTIEKQQIFAVLKMFEQERIVGFTKRGFLTIPLHNNMKFKHQHGEIPADLPSIIEQHRLPVTVTLTLFQYNDEKLQNILRQLSNITLTHKRKFKYLLCYNLYNGIPSKEFVLPIDLNLFVQCATGLKNRNKFAWLPHYAELRGRFTELPPFKVERFSDVWIYKEGDDPQLNLPDILLKLNLGPGKTPPNPITRRPPMPLPRLNSISRCNSAHINLENSEKTERFSSYF